MSEIGGAEPSQAMVQAHAALILKEMSKSKDAEGKIHLKYTYKGTAIDKKGTE